MSAKHELLKITGGREAILRRKLEKAAGDSEIAKAVVADALEQDNWESYLSDVTQHGCSSGIVSGLIYYHDTVAWYDNLKDEIWQLLYEEAQGQGIESLELIAQLNGAKNVGTDAQFKNLLAWFAYETVAYRILSASENDEEE